MAELITMLALSPTMDEGTLVEWLKNEGDSVEEGEIIAEIETDKATMEMESFHEGTVLKLLAQKGDAIPVGAPLAIIGEAGEDISDVMAEVENGGGSSAPAPTNGASEPATPAPVQAAPAPTPEAAAPSKPKRADGRVVASPVAKRIASDNGLDIAQIDGSGPGGRIIKRDVEEALKSGGAVARPAFTQSFESVADQEIPLSQMRKTIAKRLTQVWNSTPHFYLTANFDMGKAMSFRKQLNEQLAEAEAGVKVSVNDMIVKASAMAMTRYPKINVSFQGDHLLQHGESHVGVAVAIDGGLITPIVRNADRKTLSQISTEIRELAGRARDKKLKPEEYTGGGFSISNLGMFGIDHFSAIINPPEAAILACGAVQKEPVVDENGELAVGTRMKVTLSCDHRAVDGAVGAEFLIELRRLLENPFLLVV